MVAYPFAKIPKFAELKDVLRNNHGCICTGMQVEHLGQLVASSTYIQRKNSDGVPVSCVVNLTDEDSVGFDMIRSICARLEIDVKTIGFGLDLG